MRGIKLTQLFFDLLSALRPRCVCVILVYIETMLRMRNISDIYLNCSTFHFYTEFKWNSSEITKIIRNVIFVKFVQANQSGINWNAFGICLFKLWQSIKKNFILYALPFRLKYALIKCNCIKFLRLIGKSN